MRSEIHSIMIDCPGTKTVARFWAEAPGYPLGEIDEEGTLVNTPEGTGLQLLFLKVPEGKVVKNRVHHDLQPDATMEREVKRLEQLGAHKLHLVEEDGSSFTIMQDPESNEFCVECSLSERQG